MGRLLDLLSPNYTPSVHTVVTDLVKNIISMATPSPGAGLTEGLQNGPASNRFARELATKQNVTKLTNYMLTDFSADSCNTPTEDTVSEEEDGRLSSPTFESSTSSVVQSIAIIIELIRKNNSDYFEPYLFHTLRNRLIQVQQQSHLAGEDIRAALEQVMQEMVHRMGVVHLGAVLEVMSERLEDFQKYLKAPRSSVCSVFDMSISSFDFNLARRYFDNNWKNDSIHLRTLSNCRTLRRAPPLLKYVTAQPPCFIFSYVRCGGSIAGRTGRVGGVGSSHCAQ